MKIQVVSLYKEAFGNIKENIIFFIKLVLFGFAMATPLLANIFFNSMAFVIAYYILVLFPISVAVAIVNFAAIYTNKTPNILKSLKLLSFKIYMNILFGMLLAIGLYVLYCNFIFILYFILGFINSLFAITFGEHTLTLITLIIFTAGVALYGIYILFFVCPIRIAFVFYFIVLRKQTALYALSNSITLTKQHNWTMIKTWLIPLTFQILNQILIYASIMLYINGVSLTALILVNLLFFLLSILVSILYVLVILKLFVIHHKSANVSKLSWLAIFSIPASALVVLFILFNPYSNYIDQDQYMNKSDRINWSPPPTQSESANP